MAPDGFLWLPMGFYDPKQETRSNRDPCDQPMGFGPACAAGAEAWKLMGVLWAFVTE